MLCLGSAVGVAFALWVMGRDLVGLPENEKLALSAGLGTAAYAGLLWALSRTFLQQMALFAALGTAAGSAAGLPSNGEGAASGLAIWGLGTIWLPVVACARSCRLAGRAMITLSAGDWGYVFALVIVAALVALAVLLGNSVILGIAAIGPLQVLPATVMHFFPCVLTAPLALLVVGLVLLAAALYSTLRSGRGMSRRRFRYQAGIRRAALAIAAGNTLAATLVALLVGL